MRKFENRPRIDILRAAVHHYIYTTKGEGHNRINTVIKLFLSTNTLEMSLTPVV